MGERKGGHLPISPLVLQHRIANVYFPITIYFHPPPCTTPTQWLLQQGVDVAISRTNSPPSSSSPSLSPPPPRYAAGRGGDERVLGAAAGGGEVGAPAVPPPKAASQNVKAPSYGSSSSSSMSPSQRREHKQKFGSVDEWRLPSPAGIRKQSAPSRAPSPSPSSSSPSSPPPPSAAAPPPTHRLPPSRSPSTSAAASELEGMLRRSEALDHRSRRDGSHIGVEVTPETNAFGPSLLQVRGKQLTGLWRSNS